MKKHGLWLGVLSMLVACTLFFCVGFAVDGLWWLLGIPFFLAGIPLIVLSDKLNNGKQKRAEQKQANQENIKSMKENLYAQLDRDKEARKEMLKKIHGKGE